jgi:hypothetical protein
MSISEDWMDARLLGYAFKRAVFMRAGVRGGRRDWRIYKLRVCSGKWANQNY